MELLRMNDLIRFKRFIYRDIQYNLLIFGFEKRR